MKIKVGEEYETLDGRRAVVESISPLGSDFLRVKVNYNGCYLSFNYTEEGLYVSKEKTPNYLLHLKEKEQKEPFAFPEGTNKYWVSDRDGDEYGFYREKKTAIAATSKEYTPYIIYKAVGYTDSTGEYHKLKKGRK